MAHVQEKAAKTTLLRTLDIRRLGRDGIANTTLAAAPADPSVIA